jgi:hypothetical protein
MVSGVTWTSDTVWAVSGRAEARAVITRRIYA